MIDDITRGRSDPVRDHEWQDQAACGGTDSTVFYGVGEDREVTAFRKVREQVAKNLCAGCPVREECLEYALAVPERYGVWGGTNAEERAMLRKERSRLVGSGARRVGR